MQKDLIILDDDKSWARARIAALEAEIQALGPEFYDVFNQSSETWHDNAPFDALRDRQSVLDAERQRLKDILRNSLPGVPYQPSGIVGIGSTVTVENATGLRRRYFVAGDWTPHAGKTVNGATVISRNAPLAKELLGKEKEDRLRIGGKEAIIQSITG